MTEPRKISLKTMSLRYGGAWYFAYNSENPLQTEFGYTRKNAVLACYDTLYPEFYDVKRYART